MRNQKQVERSRYRDTAPVAGNGNRPRDSSSAYLAMNRARADSNLELDRPPLPHGGHSGAATKRVIPLASPVQPGESKLRYGTTWIIIGAVGLLGLYLLWRLVELRGEAHFSVAGDVLFVLAGTVVIYSAIRGRRALEEERARNEDLQGELGHLAFHDSLTGLANRTLFSERLEHALSRRRGAFMVHAVLMIDLNGFKSVNDSLGHDAGDDVLRAVGDRLRGAVRQGDTVARFGADEFAILFEDVNGEDSARVLVEQILRIVRQPITMAEREVVPEVSIGVAVTGAQPYSAQDLLRFADTAMREAKQQRQSHYAFFEAGMQIALTQRVQLEADLQGAARRGELRVFYQPIVDLVTQETIGVEALLRWMHPERGMLEPAAFLSLAESGGLIHEIDTWVLNQACVEASRWQHEDHRFSQIGVNVNLSPLQLREPDLVETVVDALDVAGLESHFLTLELVESSVVDDLELAHARLTELKELGVRIAVDDFGTGYSSLNHLRILPIDELKIDRSFVAAMETSLPARTLVHSLIQLGAALQIATVAEGVEGLRQLRHLQDEGCLRGQGYYFSPPLDRDDLRRYLAGGCAAFETRLITGSPA